jgi:hypothetical protein
MTSQAMAGRATPPGKSNLAPITPIWLRPRLRLPLRWTLLAVLALVAVLAATGNLVARTPLQDLFRVYPVLDGALTLRDYKARQQPSGSALMSLYLARWRASAGTLAVWRPRAQPDPAAALADWDHGRLIGPPGSDQLWPVPTNPDWTEDPFADPAWVDWYESLAWLEAPAYGYLLTGDSEYATTVRAYVLDWIDAHPAPSVLETENAPGARAWLPSVTAQRLDTLVYLFDRALATNTGGAPNASRFVRALFDHGRLIGGSLFLPDSLVTPADLEATMSLYQLAVRWPDLRLADSWRFEARTKVTALAEGAWTAFIGIATADELVTRFGQANVYLAQFLEPLTLSEQALVAGILPGGPAGYQFCAHEGQVCVFTGTRDVAFGVGSHFINRSALSGPVACDVVIFGETATGLVRSCYLR